MDEYHKHREYCPFTFAPLDVCDCVQKNMADRIEALEARVAAADKLAEAVRKTGYRIDHKGVITLIDSFGMMPINAALAAYQATKEGG